MILKALLAVLLMCGILGGMIGFLGEITGGKNKSWPLFWQYFLLGIAASFIVPLFLNTISSTLVVDALSSKPADATGKLLVIAGFCLVAAISSRAFIDRISQKLLQEVNDVKQELNEARREVTETRRIAEGADEKADLVVEPDEPMTFPRVSSVMSTERRSHQPRTDELDENMCTVLHAVYNSTFSTRAFSGIANDTGLPEVALKETIEKLVGESLLEKKTTTKGYERWSLTGEGRAEARKIDANISY